MSIKNAQALPPGAKAMPSDKSSQTGVARQRTVPSGGSGVAKTSGRPTQEEKQHVIAMQSIMMALGNAMNTNRKEMAERLGISEQSAVNIAAKIQDTGGSASKALDGIWGNKTIGALTEIAKLANTLGTAKINSGKNYKEVSPDNIINIAKANVDAIAELMRAVGLGSAVPKDVGARPGAYDVVPDTISSDNIREYPSTGTAVQPSSFDNIHAFFNLAQMLLNADQLPQASAAGEKLSLEKIAEIIKSSNIVKLAQVVPEKVVLEEQPVKQKPTGMTVAKLDAALNWFNRRANDVLYKAQLATTVGDGGSQAAVKHAEDYKAAVNNLMRVWQAQRPYILNDRDPEDVSVSASDLKHIKDIDKYKELQEQRAKQKEQTGLARERGSDDKPVEKRTATDILSKFPNGPLGKVINLSSMLEYLPSDASSAWFQQHVRRAEFDYSALRSSNLGSPKSLVRLYKSRDSQIPAKRFAIQLVDNLYTVIQNIYEVWSIAAERVIDSGAYDEGEAVKMQNIIDSQRRMQNQWLSLLSYKANQADRWNPVMYDNRGNVIRR